MVRITCDFGTDDPDIAKMLIFMQSLSPYDELRLEMEAMLYSQMARLSWQEAALARQRRTTRENAVRRAADRKAAKLLTETDLLDNVTPDGDLDAGGGIRRTGTDTGSDVQQSTSA